MAYEPRAAISSQTAEISSSRDRASTAHPVAPTRATAVHTRIDFGVVRDRRGGGPPGAGRADSGTADVDMAAPHLSGGVGRYGGTDVRTYRTYRSNGHKGREGRTEWL
ncbi:hypothetical protein GCM10023083_17950 [Streptomyces phyllanthi]